MPLIWFFLLVTLLFGIVASNLLYHGDFFNIEIRKKKGQKK